MRRGPRPRRWRARVLLCLAVEAGPDRRAEAEPEWARRVAPVSLDDGRTAARIQRKCRHAASSLFHGTIRSVHLLNCKKQKQYFSNSNTKYW